MGTFSCCVYGAALQRSRHLSRRREFSELSAKYGHTGAGARAARGADSCQRNAAGRDRIDVIRRARWSWNVLDWKERWTGIGRKSELCDGGWSEFHSIHVFFSKPAYAAPNLQ